MQELTAEGRRLVADAGARYGFSEDAVLTMLNAVAASGGSQAQFSHPEFGGMGQWQRGGMIMIGDMFNQNLKYRVDGLCTELSNALGGPMIWQPLPAQSQSQYGGSQGSSLFFSGGSGWPAELGAPSSSGSQNDLSYAFFPMTRRLAIRRGGDLRVYDTGNHSISGVSQQQGGDQSLTFTSQYGLVRISDLTPVSMGPVAAPEPAPYEAANFAAPPPPPRAPAPMAPEPQYAPNAPIEPSFIAEPAKPAPQPASNEDIFAKLERLAELKQKGVLTEEEFAKKKADLLDRL